MEYEYGMETLSKRNSPRTETRYRSSKRRQKSEDDEVGGICIGKSSVIRRHYISYRPIICRSACLGGVASYYGTLPDLDLYI